MTTSAWPEAATSSALRNLPPPVSPPPGSLDAVVGYLLARIAPFDAPTQQLLRKQQGWGTGVPTAIPADRSWGRWKATPALRRLTAATPPPQSLIDALTRLECMTPCSAGDAAAGLLTAGLTDVPMHPGGVLNLARMYSLPTSLRLICSGRDSMLLGDPDAAVTKAVHQLMTALSRAGCASVAEPTGLGGRARRELDYLLSLNRRARRAEGLLVLVDDRTSGLFLQVSRMLRFASRPLTEGELCAGLARHWRFRPTRLPSEDTVSSWLDAQSWLRRADNAVSLGTILTRAETAKTDAGGTAELAAAVAGGTTAAWAQLVAALTVKGVKPETAKMAAHTNPVLVHVGPNQYRLRGS